MGMLRIITVGALGYVGYRAWQRRRAAAPQQSLEDDTERTSPHGDPLARSESTERDDGPMPADVQTSPGFGVS